MPTAGAGVPGPEPQVSEKFFWTRLDRLTQPCDMLSKSGSKIVGYPTLKMQPPMITTYPPPHNFKSGSKIVGYPIQTPMITTYPLIRCFYSDN